MWVVVNADNRIDDKIVEPWVDNSTVSDENVKASILGVML